MPPQADRQRFRNEDLVLTVTQAVDRAQWNEGRYEAFLQELCDDREYQKEAIRTALRYVLGGQYANLRALAQENFNQKPVLHERYGTWAAMQRQLQLPDQYSASLDLATGTGKSYVLYGIAAIMLAEGAVDSVLVLCPSTTIEHGLITKFEELSSRAELRDWLPPDAQWTAPDVINASESIVGGSLCVENYHAVLERVRSSIRDSLQGKGARVLVLNDEVHHVANESGSTPGKWKQFLTDPAFGFQYILGVSGTCYVGDDYFADVIYRYSLRQAMEEQYVKRVDYVAEMPRTGVDNEKWQLVRNRHEEIKQKLERRNLVPLTIVVTQTIQQCKNVTEQIKAFLMETEDFPLLVANQRVLCVYNNAPDVFKLANVDLPSSQVEWIVAVSMLNEGWDVKRVFQIVPHEERAFNSKLLIAQVLGRGLRIPNGWNGAPPEVTVFNHDAWAPRIKSLVDEVLEIEKRVSSHIVSKSSHHFDLHTIDYSLISIVVKTPMTGPYNLLEKGYVELAADVAAEDVTGVFERAASGHQYQWQTTVRHRTYTPQEIAQVMFERLEEADESDDTDGDNSHSYTEQFPLERLEQIVRKSLELRSMSVATESARQRFLQALGTLQRKETQSVRFVLNPDNFRTVSTRERPAESVSAAELRRDKTFFFTDETRSTLKDEQLEFFDEVSDPGNGFKHRSIANRFDFKTPLNAAIASSEPERRFMNALLDPQNLEYYEAWIKSTTIGFYGIDYFWRKSGHTQQNKFNPDFFIKTTGRILVVEIKDDSELQEPSEENRKKSEYAAAHFDRVNQRLEDEENPLRYQFTFLTPSDFNTYFQYLRTGNIASFQSELDLKLREDG